MYDTIIIGAGMSGLAAGIRLAHYDQKVCILEKHYTIGGLNSFYRMNGRDYDVGLHAVTNFTAKGAKKGPLARILRQLRFKWEDFALAPQKGSRIAFPDHNLRFDNDLELLRSEVRKEFPRNVDEFDHLVAKISDYDDLDQASFELSGRQILNETISEPVVDRDDSLPADVVRKRGGTRHGLGPVLHHVPQHFPRRFCSPLQRRAADPEESG